MFSAAGVEIVHPLAPAAMAAGYTFGFAPTVTFSVLVPVSAPSLALKLNTYAPEAPVRRTEVEAASGVARMAPAPPVGLAGALTNSHVYDSVLPAGRPSSVALPVSVIVSVGIATLGAVPAFVTGAVFV